MSVHFDQKRNKFIALATINGKRTYLGQRDTRYEAEYLVQQSKPTLTSIFDTEPCNEFGKPTWYSRIRNFFMSKRG